MRREAAKRRPVLPGIRTLKEFEAWKQENISAAAEAYVNNVIVPRLEQKLERRGLLPKKNKKLQNDGFDRQDLMPTKNEKLQNDGVDFQWTVNRCDTTWDVVVSA